MSLKHLSIGALVAVCIFVAQASAQKNELTGVLGRTFISDQGIQGALVQPSTVNFGKGLTFEVNVAHRMLDSELWSLALEIPFVVNKDEDINSALGLTPKQFSSFFVTPAARLNLFAEQGVSPWISFGGGFGHFGESSQLEYGGRNPGSTGTTVGVVQAGIGLDVKLVGKLRLRGEARDFYSGVPQLNVKTGKSMQHNIFVGAGVVWRF